MGFQRKEQRTANTGPSEVWCDIAKANLATPVKRRHANDGGVELCYDETTVEVGAPAIEVFGGLVPQPPLEGRAVVPMIQLTQLL